jgi:predicted metalloprotease with PDZ domain
MSSSKLYQDPSRNQSEPAPLKPAIVSSSSSLSSAGHNDDEATVAADARKQQQILIKQRSQSSFHLPSDAPIPRLCRVRAYEEQLGFTVAGSKANRGVFKVNDISANSPAAHAGLHNDDYIIEISGVNVESMSYQDVIALIKNKKQQDDLQLLVADRQTIQWYKNQKIPISSQVIPKMLYIETLLKEELQPSNSQSFDQDISMDNSPNFNNSDYRTQYQ